MKVYKVLFYRSNGLLSHSMTFYSWRLSKIKDFLNYYHHNEDYEIRNFEGRLMKVKKC